MNFVRTSHCLFLGCFVGFFVFCSVGQSEAGARSVFDKLRAGESVTVVIFGDSISAGYQLGDPEEDSFYAIFRRVLRRTFPDARAEVVSKGFPGATVADGFSLVDRAVLPLRPDFVTVQFGGNDERLKTPPGTFREKYLEIIRSIRSGTDADVMLLIQPFQQRAADSPMTALIREVAREADVPVADFDTALRKRPHDFRGWYAPFFNHPREYSSNIMARELWRAFCAAGELGMPVDVRILDFFSTEDRGDSVEAVAKVENLGVGSRRLCVDLGWSDSVRSFSMILPAHSTREVTFPVPVTPPNCRSVQKKLFCFVESGGNSAFDVKWLTAAPVLVPGVSRPGRPEQFPVHWGNTPALLLADQEHIVYGPGNWGGPGDLSVKLHCLQDEINLYFGLDVTDDKLVVFENNRKRRTMFFGDCVQVYFDVRQPGRQGMPFFDEQVHQFFLVPGLEQALSADWSFGDEEESTVLPSERWEGIQMRSRRTDRGYRIELTVPKQSLRPDGEQCSMVGFDLLVDDTDAGAGRETQIVWAGTELNYLNPAFYGGLYLEFPASGRHKNDRLMRITCH